jgi:hypothetical protein
MVLRLRIAPRLWSSVVKSDREFDSTLQGYMNENASWISSNPQAQGLARDIIEVGNFRLWLTTPQSPASRWDYEVIHIQELKPKEHTPQSQGARIDTEILILPPTAVEGPHPTLAPAPPPAKPVTIASVDQALTKTDGGRIIFLLKIPTYRQLPEHEREPLNMAWRKAKHGRSAKRVFWKDDAIFILTPDDTAPTNANAAASLNEALEQYDAGRVITDSYEVRRALELADKFGTIANGSSDSQ